MDRIQGPTPNVNTDKRWKMRVTQAIREAGEVPVADLT